MESTLFLAAEKQGGKSDDAIFWRSTFSKAPIATTIPVVGTKNYGTSKTSILAVVKNYYRNIE